MLASLLLLAALVLPSEQDPKTVDQKLTALINWSEQWRALSSNRENTAVRSLERITTAGTDVKAQLEELIVDFAELVKTVQVIQKVTSQLLIQCNSSQLLIELQILKGRQAVGGPSKGGRCSCSWLTWPPSPSSTW